MLAVVMESKSSNSPPPALKPGSSVICALMDGMFWHGEDSLPPSSQQRK
jgi:hypothetical protein